MNQPEECSRIFPIHAFTLNKSVLPLMWLAPTYGRLRLLVLFFFIAPQGLFGAASTVDGECPAYRIICESEQIKEVMRELREIPADVFAFEAHPTTGQLQSIVRITAQLQTMSDAHKKVGSWDAWYDLASPVRKYIFQDREMGKHLLTLVWKGLSNRPVWQGEYRTISKLAQAAGRDLWKENFEEQLATLPREIQEALKAVNTIEPAVLAGEKPPLWSDIVPMQRAVGLVSDVLARQGKSLSEIIPVATREAIREYFKRKCSRNNHPSPHGEPTVYQPGEYAFRREFRRLIDILHEFLPDELTRPRGLSPDESGPSRIKQAEMLIRELSERAARLFPSSGFADDAALRRAILGAPDQPEQRALQALDNEKLSIVIGSSENVREGVRLAGIQNQHVIGRSHSTAAFAPATRRWCEARYLGIGEKEYDALPNDVKPKYAYLHGIDSGWGTVSRTALSNKEETYAYGKDRYHLKMSTIRDRLTFTLGDSINRMRNLIPQDLGAPDSWDQLFMPWKYRSLLALPLSYTLSIEPAVTSPHNLPVNHWSVPPALKSYSIGLDTKYPLEGGRSKGIVEFQVWGPLTLDDVEAFEFYGRPPSGEFLKALLDRNIRIIEGTTQKEWKPR